MKTEDKYLLIGQTVVPCDDLLEWAMTNETQDRRVAIWRRGPFLVSTVFIGLAMNIDRVWNPELPPHVFETMIFFLGASTDYQERCATWMEAEAMHGKAITYVCSTWRRPRELAGWILQALEYWIWQWDRRFASRYPERTPWLGKWRASDADCG